MTGRPGGSGVRPAASGGALVGTGPGTAPRHIHLDRRQGRHDLVLVANRLPVMRAGPEAEWQPSPGGLVRALLGLARHRMGAWVGWAGDAGPAPAPMRLDGVDMVPVALDEDDVAGFYDGMSNETLWPLYHDALRTPQFDQGWWESYVTVNRRFATAAARTAAPGAVVWVHDYHLQLVPGMLRELRPDLRIGFFLHIPFPPQELFLRLPWREELLRGLLGADVIGFQREVGARNLATVARRVLGAGGAGSEVTFGGRPVRIQDYPISIDVAEIEEIARRPSTDEAVRRLRQRLGDPDVVYLGIDRLDYTKGIDLRLQGFGRLLDRSLLGERRAVLVQVAVPTRDRLDHYLEERRRVEQLVGEVNGAHSGLGEPAVHYLHRSLSLDELVVLYRAADVMLVTPLRDGMNLVAKEFVASRVDGGGTMVLSEFAGAADELAGALLVNPHDDEALTNAMAAAANLPPAEARRRMAADRARVTAHDVARWADGFLADLMGDQVSLRVS